MKKADAAVPSCGMEDRAEEDSHGSYSLIRHEALDGDVLLYLLH